MDTEGSRWSDYWTAERGCDGSPAYRRRGHGQPGEPLQPGGAPGSGRRALFDALEEAGRRPREIDFLSTTYFLDDELDTAVANAIFADGAGAMVLACDGPGPRILGTCTLVRPEYLDLMGFTFPQGRQRILLSKDIRHIAAEMMRELIAEILQTHGLVQADVRHWVLHSAGVRVLEQAQLAGPRWSDRDRYHGGTGSLSGRGATQRDARDGPCAAGQPGNGTRAVPPAAPDCTSRSRGHGGGVSGRPLHLCATLPPSTKTERGAVAYSSLTEVSGGGARRTALWG